MEDTIKTLSADEVSEISDIRIAAATANDTLNQMVQSAYDHHRAEIQTLVDRENAFWANLIDQYKLDPSKDYKIGEGNTLVEVDAMTGGDVTDDDPDGDTTPDAEEPDKDET